MSLQVWFAFTETSVAAGNNRTRLGLTGFGWRLDLITTMARVMRIPLLAPFFISVAEFALEHSRIDLAVMTGAFTILLWAGYGSRDILIRLPENALTISRNRRANILKTLLVRLCQYSGP